MLKSLLAAVAIVSALGLSAGAASAQNSRGAGHRHNAPHHRYHNYARNDHHHRGFSHHPHPNRRGF